MIDRRTLLLALPALAAARSAWAQVDSDVVRHVNAYRQRNGLPPLALHKGLTAAAQHHADDMARRRTLTHNGADGSYLDGRMRRIGYRYGTVAENIAAGQRTPREAVQSWINNPPHRANMLRQEVVDAGAGWALTDQDYWVLVVAGPLF